ncbi:MAG: TolC family protein [Candidatus Rokubacteria bacterium]|nr:TolC family protein [Candidatus Rokubacteria bacterium]
MSRRDHARGLRLGIAGLLAVLATAAGASAQAPRPAGTVVLTLADAVKAAVTRSPEVRGAALDVEAFLAKKEQADGARWPQLTALGVVGPSPEAERLDGSGLSTPLRSVNAREGAVNGAFGRLDLLLVQPIYTFGLIDNLRAAAEHGVRARQAGRDKTAAEVALRVREAYTGLLLFRELGSLLDDLHEQLVRAGERLELLQEGGFAAEQDVFKLRALQGELEKNMNMAARGAGIAAEALRVWTGLPAGASVEPGESRLLADLEPLPPLERFVEDARANRPEFTQLAAGLRAKRALVEAERAKAWPMVFFGIQGSVAQATNRDRVLNNAYLSDPLQHAYIGPVLGLRYDLDFGVASGRVREAQAEVAKLETLRVQAVEGIPLQVARAHGEVREAAQNVAVLDRARDNAKKWVVSASANVDLGIGDTKDLADAVLALAKTRAEYLQAVFNYRVGLARLDNAAGRDLEEIRALMAGTVTSLTTAEVTR